MQALCKLASLPPQLLSQLLNSDAASRGAPDLPPFRRQESKLQSGLASTLKHSFNQSQLAALAAVLGRPGHISLVQVRPGIRGQSRYDARWVYGCADVKGTCSQLSAAIQASTVGHAAGRESYIELRPGLVLEYRLAACTHHTIWQPAGIAWRTHLEAMTRHFLGLQGPPGTGKTATILGIASVLLAHPPPAVQEAAAAAPTPTAALTVRLPAPGAHNSRPSSAAPEAPKLLACAQSNAAIDELLARLAEKGVFSAQDGSRRCWLLCSAGALICCAKCQGARVQSWCVQDVG